MADKDQLWQTVDRLLEIKAQVELLNTEKSELEGVMLKQCQTDLANTKLKTVLYPGTNGKVTATIASSLKIAYPAFLKRIFGDAYEDVVTVNTTYKLSAPAARMMTGIWKGEYTEMTVAQVVDQLSCEERAKAVLKKKLRGANYETDRKNLMLIAHLPEQEASEYAYFVSEAAVWESFQQLLAVRNDGVAPANSNTVVQQIGATFVVEDTPKITLEAN